MPTLLMISDVTRKVNYVEMLIIIFYQSEKVCLFVCSIEL